MKMSAAGPAAFATLAALLFAAPGPRADDELEAVPPVAHQATLEECGECHMAYQPALLPRESWAAIMDGLADHFGEDASLSPAVAAEIRAYLVGASVPARRKLAQPVLAITEQRWWQHEHDDIRPSAWRDPKVLSKSNCPACHKGAERGIYEDADESWERD